MMESLTGLVPAPPSRVATKTSAAQSGWPKLGFTKPKLMAKSEPAKEEKIEAHIKPINFILKVL
ncbi:MAG: hypothetical protein A2157_00965 [Deltaproteobacteria bacterium RBG_16_47_11]|nr:MAG: hypothetical protein A2157_00965 [Deltaproteobacteria bacterium RBG_16_47_11]